MQKNKAYQSGFTLIELLIVIAIIAVLSLVVFVSLDPITRFAEVRNSSRWKVVNSIAEAIKLYQIDNDGNLPPGIDSTLRMLGTDSSGCDVVCGGNTSSESASVDTETETVSVRVSSGSDDAEERDPPGGYISMYSTDLELAYDSATEQEIGMRFRSINIPQGSDIVSAYIDFTVDETDSGNTNLVFYGEDTDDASNFNSNYGNITARTKTSASVAWSNVPSWDVVDEIKTTPNLQNIVQEIVDRVGWVSGNDLVIIVTGNGERTAKAYDGNNPEAPLLRIEYAVESGGGGEGATEASGSAQTESACLDLSADLAPYLKYIPFDSQEGSSQKTYYAVQHEASQSGVMTVYSCGSELGEVISVSK